ncbi:MAG: ATP-binding protein, partial [Anaerolineae bacterium]
MTSESPMTSDHHTPSSVGQVESERHSMLSEDPRLSVLFEIVGIFATEYDLDTMLSRSLSSLVDTLEAAQAGVVLLFDPVDERLTARAACGYDLSILRSARLAIGEATCGTTFQTGQPKLYPTPRALAKSRTSLTSDNARKFREAVTGEAWPQSAVCMPLFTGESKIGVLALENRVRPTSFVEADLPFLQAVVDLVALAVQNARLRRKLQESRALDEANRLKGELLSILAHEMRTPLTSIKGYSTALLLQEASFDSQTQREMLEVIDEECDTLESLVHDLLESSIIDAGLLRLEPQPVMLPKLSRESIDEIAHRTDNHRFMIDFPKDFPIVDADPDRIRQVLRNLLDNAVKYSPDGGLVVARGELTETEVIVSVADQGVGISPEHLNRLFEKFFRVDSGLDHHIVGSGLGLPISRTIIEAHGGRIWAESAVGQGSTFYFTLPLDGIGQQ